MVFHWQKNETMKSSYCCITILLLLWTSLQLSAQEAQSRKVSIRLSNIPPEMAVMVADTLPPAITILNPGISSDSMYRCDTEEISLIGEVSDASPVKFVSVNTEVKHLDESGIFTTVLRLSPGVNLVRIVAMDENRNLEELKLYFVYTPHVLSLADKITAGGKYYGLIIGIDKYRDYQLPDLLNPVSDAQKFYDVLLEDYMFEKGDLRLVKNATRAKIIEELDALAWKIGSEDNLLIFYAGHGWWDEDANTGYWLPSDAESDKKTNWFRNSTLVDYLREINSKHTLLITDACFSGSIFKTRSIFASQEGAYEKLYELSSRKAMTSGTLTVVPDRSSFTRFMLQRLQENDEMYLSSEELFSSFRMAVINNSNAIPQYGEISNVGDQGGDFIFLKRRK
jgi:caspase domain-containing protein